MAQQAITSLNPGNLGTREKSPSHGAIQYPQDLPIFAKQLLVLSSCLLKSFG